MAATYVLIFTGLFYLPGFASLQACTNERIAWQTTTNITVPMYCQQTHNFAADMSLRTYGMKPN